MSSIIYKKNKKMSCLKKDSLDETLAFLKCSQCVPCFCYGS